MFNPLSLSGQPRNVLCCTGRSGTTFTRTSAAEMRTYAIISGQLGVVRDDPCRWTTPEMAQLPVMSDK